MRTYRYEKHSNLTNQLAFANTLIIALILAFFGSFGYILISNLITLVGSI